MIENLFINILGISITSSAAVAVILLISKLAENKFRKKWRYWIWIFLAVYLIVPIKINLPSAPIKMDVPPHEMIITQSPETVERPAVIPESGEQVIQPEHEEKPAVPDLSTEGNSVSTEPKTFIFPVVFVGAVIWISGAVIVCGWNIAMYIRFLGRSKPWNREIKDEFVLNLFECIKKEMDVPEKVKIYENRLIKSPMMVGFTKPRVLLPSEALLPEEYEFVLRHELTHYRRGDLWYKMLLMLAASVHWFNPFIGFMCRNAENDIEITCDEAVVKAMEGDRRQEYCATILNIMRRGQNSPLLLSTSFYGGKKFLKSRFAAVLNPKTHRGVALFILAAIVIIISGTMVACVPEEAEPTENENNFEVGTEDEIESKDNIENKPEESQKPVVTGPDEEGKFPMISHADWDRWVNYGGESQTEEEKPVDPISSILECPEYLEYLKEEYPRIKDWEILYETSDYKLVHSYDPYNYSFRYIYMPSRFAVLKTEQSEEFDILFVNTFENYSAQYTDEGYIPQKEFGSKNCVAFEEDLQIGNMEGAETYYNYYYGYTGVWFPEEGKTIIFDIDYEKAYAVYGTTEPVYAFTMTKLDRAFDVNDRRIDLSENWKKFHRVGYSFDENCAREDMRIALYDSEEKRLIHFEGLEDYSEWVAQFYWLDSENLVFEGEGVLYFYNAENPTKLIEKIGGNGNGVYDGKLISFNYIKEDKTQRGRYAWFYNIDETQEHGCLIFDCEGNIIENFTLGLYGGYIGSYSFHDGLIYFSFHGSERYNYAVDARPGKDHVLQANAW